MPESQKMAESRARAAWRVHACAAGLCTGAQVFLLGCGVALPTAMNSAWIASLATLPASALTVRLCARRDRRTLGRGAALLLAMTLLLCAVFAAASLVAFAEQTLLEQAQTTWSASVALFAALLCALSGAAGVSRLCFALRWFVPVVLVGLSVLSVPIRIPVGLFPLLGAGWTQLGVAAVCMLAGAVPSLMLLLSPAELEERGMGESSLMPDTPFFLRRVLAGAGVGVLLVFAACVFTTYESIAENGEWGARLRIAAGYQPHEGLAQTLLTVLELMAMLLLLVNMLCSAERALLIAVPKLNKGHIGLLALLLLMGLCMALLIVFGFDAALVAAPLLVVPMGLVLLLARGRRRRA